MSAETPSVQPDDLGGLLVMVASALEPRPAAVDRGRSLIGQEGWCPSYAVASALVEETTGVFGRSWIRLLRQEP
jgi:hypothetical protein